MRKPIIGGVEIETPTTFTTHDPSNGAVLEEVYECAQPEVDRAVEAARSSFESRWGTLSPRDRATRLTRLAQLISEKKEDLAKLETLDCGKPLSQSRRDVEIASEYFEYYASVVRAFFGSTIPNENDRLVYVVREPHGVTGHITPWNYPLQIAARTLAPALAAGNCAVLKPAEDTPLTALELAKLALEADLPAGTLNVCTGDGKVGALLAEHQGINHVSFTGSVPTGRAVATAASKNLTTVGLELGGKSPNIVFEDADLEHAVPAIVNSIIQNGGQTCVAGSRLLAADAIHHELVQRLVGAFKDLTVGPGIEDPDLGPLINEKQASRVGRYVSEASRTAPPLWGGRQPDDVALAGGSYYCPTIFDNVAATSPLAQEEVFGPVLAVTPFSGEEEALGLANGTRYGLVSAVWTRDIGRAHRMIARLESGQVFVNTYGAGGGVELPFGGVKDSGYGREKGFEALYEYTSTKTAVIATS